MRTIPAALCAVALLATPATPASAASEEVFYGTMTFARFGTGGSSGTASMTIAGGGSVTATFWVYASPSLCPAFAEGYGTVSGALSGSFSFTIVQNVITMSIDGQHYSLDGGGAFVVASPVGNPCGQSNVQATVAGVLAGV